MRLKGWVVKVLSFILGSWFCFVALTIENVLENRTYDIILLVWTIAAIGSFALLNKYSDLFND